jgi:hypothetical protein
LVSLKEVVEETIVFPVTLVFPVPSSFIAWSKHNAMKVLRQVRKKSVINTGSDIKSRTKNRNGLDIISKAAYKPIGISVTVRWLSCKAGGHSMTVWQHSVFICFLQQYKGSMSKSGFLQSPSLHCFWCSNLLQIQIHYCSLYHTTKWQIIILTFLDYSMHKKVSNKRWKS